MPPLPRITGRQLVRALGKQGWVVVVQKGSHAQLKHPSRGGRVTVPLHAGETIGPGLLRSILSQAGVTVEELRAVLCQHESDAYVHNRRGARGRWRLLRDRPGL